MMVAGLKRRRSKAVRLSIVIPAYNDEARRPETLGKTVDWCGAHNLEFEVVVVDDGSRDEPWLWDISSRRPTSESVFLPMRTWVRAPLSAREWLTRMAASSSSWC